MFDQIIINKFGLFLGTRSKKEDEGILARLQEAVINETARFLTENKKDNIEEIPFWKTRLESRINYFLTTLLIKAGKKHE